MRNSEVIDANGFHTFEMLKVISCDDYRLIREATVMNAKNEKFRYYDLTKNTFISEEFKGMGVIMVIVHPDSKPAIFAIRVNPRRLLGDDTYVGIFEPTNHNINEMIERINKILLHIDAHWDFEAMNLSRLDLCANKIFENPYESAAYMRLIRKSLMPAGYTKKKFESDEPNYQEKNKKSFRIWNGARTITVYDKRFQLEEEHLGEIDSMDSKGLLRFEISLSGREINKLTGSRSNREKLEYFATHAMGIMLRNFDKVFFSLPYFRYQLAIDMINDAAAKKIVTTAMSKKMIEMVQTISAYKNMNAALIYLKYTDWESYDKKIQYKKVAKLKEGFIKVGLNPITIKGKEPWGSLHSITQLLNGESRGEDN